MVTLSETCIVTQNVRLLLVVGIMIIAMFGKLQHGDLVNQTVKVPTTIRNQSFRLLTLLVTSEQRGDAPLVDAPDAALPPQRARHVDRPLVLGRPRRGLLHLKEERIGRRVEYDYLFFAADQEGRVISHVC